MTGSPLAPVIIPVVVIALAVWLALVFYTDAYPVTLDPLQRQNAAPPARYQRRRELRLSGQPHDTHSVGLLPLANAAAVVATPGGTPSGLCVARKSGAAGA